MSDLDEVLDVRAGNVLFGNLPADEVEPTRPEGLPEKCDGEHSAFLIPQPTSPDWGESECEMPVEVYDIVLIDFSDGKMYHNFYSHGCYSDSSALISAKWMSEKSCKTNYPLNTTIALRAPELILQAGYDCKIDIWAVGCMVSVLQHSAVL